VPAPASDFIHAQGVIWVAHIMRRLASRIVDASDEVLVDYGVTVPSNMVSVVHLLHTRGQQTVMAIAAETVQSHPLIHKYVKQLVKLGLATTEVDAADRRRTYVQLTARGEVQARKLVQVREHFVPALEALMLEADAPIFEQLWRMEAALERRSMTDRIREQQHARPLGEGAGQ
jgi:DNA-binding MarR family transcriptional regulator